MGLLARRRPKVAPEAHADRRRLSCWRSRACPTGRSRAAAWTSSGASPTWTAAEVDMHVLSATPQTYLYDQEPALRRRLRGAPERSDRQAREGASGRFMGIATLPMQAPRARRRGASPRRAHARPARRHDRLERHGQEPRRSGARAGVGGGGRARRLHDHPSDQRRRRRPAALLLSQQSDRQSARHHHRGGLPRVRRRAGAASEAERLPRARRRLRALSRPDAGRTAGRCGRSRRSTSSSRRSRGSTASITTPSCTRSRSSNSWSASVGSERVLLGSDYPYDMGTGECVRQVKALSIAEADKAKLLCDNALALLGVS